MARNFGGLFEFSMFKISPEGVRTELDADAEEAPEGHQPPPLGEGGQNLPASLGGPAAPDADDIYYEEELGDAIYAHVDAFLSGYAGVKESRFQVETYANNGGPLIDYFLTVESDDDRSPMWALSLEGITVPWPERGDGWRIGVSAGGVRSEKEYDSDGDTIVSEEEEDEAEEEEVGDADPAIVATSGFSHEACIAAAEKSELYPPLVAYLESLPGMTVHVSPKNGDTLGVNTAGEVFKVGIDDRKAGRERFELWRIGKAWDAAKKTYRLVF